MKKSNRKRKKKERKRLKKIRRLKAMIDNPNIGILYRLMLRMELSELTGEDGPKTEFNWYERSPVSPYSVDHPQPPR